MQRVGIPKASITDKAIGEVHQFSLLQRLRQNRDLKAYDPMPVVSEPVDDFEATFDDEGIENV